jgi:hypothetical protein
VGEVQDDAIEGVCEDDIVVCVYGFADFEGVALFLVFLNYPKKWHAQGLERLAVDFVLGFEQVTEIRVIEFFRFDDTRVHEPHS